MRHACWIVLLLGCAAERRAAETADGGILESGGPGPGDGDASGEGTDADESDDGEDAADTEPSFDVGNGDGASADGGEGGECPCENVLDGIYVLDSNAPASVWFYDPPQNAFTMIGPLGCPAPAGAVANSMAIDREGNAWLNYYAQVGLGGYEGWLFRAPLDALGTCEMLDYHAQGSWYLMGMGYSVVGQGSSCDELYLYNSDDYVEYPNVSGGSELASWDEAASQRTGIGATGYPVAELSGTGDGRLFAFATVAENQSTLVQLDKATGLELEATPLELDITQAFAFAFWGGDVYFFTEVTFGGTDSKVSKLDYDGNEGGGLSVVKPTTGLRITGAGVSTCASFEPPG